MRKLIWIAGVILGTALLLPAQGRGRGGGMGAAPGAMHSNAPAGTPSASGDRDLGRQRAEDAGRGKQNGQHKTRARKSHKARHARSTN